MIFTPVVILGPYVHQLKKVKEIKPEITVRRQVNLSCQCSCENMSVLSNDVFEEQMGIDNYSCEFKYLTVFNCMSLNHGKNSSAYL